MSEPSETPGSECRAPLPGLGLRGGEVHVWRASLRIEAGELERLESHLSDDERRRAARFRLPELRRRYVAAHGVLRVLLGSYLRVAPSVPRFQLNAHDKPFLIPECSAELKFNLSHAGEMALFAFALAREVGVDIEQIRPMPSGVQIADRFFTPAESARIRSAPPESRDEVFFEHWVRKEAFVKAVGQGVSFGLNRFQLPEVPGGSPTPVPFTCPPDPAVWSLAPLRAGDEYTGAVVAAGTDWRPSLFHWPDA